MYRFTNPWIAVVGFLAYLSSLAITITTTVASWISGTVTYGIQTGGESIKYLSFATTSYACSFAVFEGLCVSHTLSTSRGSAAQLVVEAANDFATAAERNVKLRLMSVNIAVFETEIHSLEMSLKFGKYQSPLLHNLEDYTTRLPALSDSLRDFVSNNSVSSLILLLATESLDRTLIKLARDKSQSNLRYRIKQTSHRTLRSWSPFTCLQAELAKAYRTWLTVLKRENNLRMIQSQQILAQFDDLEGRLRGLKSDFSLANEVDKSNKAGLFGWLNHEYWNGHKNPILRQIDKRLCSAKEHHKPINLTQQYLHSTQMQYQEQDSKIMNLQAFLVSPAVYASHDIDNVTAASKLISRSVTNLQATHRYLQTIKDPYTEAFGRPIVQNGTVVIDFGTTITEEKSLID